MAALTAVVASTLAPAAVLPAQAAVAGMSAVDAQNGYPTWFSDGNVKLQFCYMAGAGCLSEPPNPDAPASYPDNFPEEAFWFNAEASGGNLGLYEAALEGAHLNGEVIPGEQMGFGRLRFRINNLVTGASYTVRHPYGTNTFTAAAGRINTTIDAGSCAPTATRACDWAGVGEAFLGTNAGTTTSTFLKQVGAAPGTLGDINTPRAVTGAPSGLNAVTITGPNAGGPGVNTLTVSQFTVQGLIFNGADAAPSTPDLAAASDSGKSSTDNITNLAAPTFTGTVPGIGATEASVGLMVDGAATPAVDGATFNGGYSLTLPTNLTSGVHRVQARIQNPAYVLDEFGNPVDATIPQYLTSGTLTFTVDTVAPPVSIVAPFPSNPSADNTPTVSFTGEAGAAYECQLLPSNPDWDPTCVSPKSYDQQLNGSYTFNVRATDAAGNVGAVASRAWRIGPADIAPPTAPGAPRAVAAGANGMTVSWTASTDDTGVVRYDIYRDGAATPTGSSTTTSFTDTGLAEASSHSYVVKAVDGANNASAASASATGRTADVSSPSMPTSVTATAASTTSITVRWTASTDNVGVTGYRVYRDGVATAVGSPTATSFTDTGLAPGSTHTYEVAAIDAANNLTTKTAAVSATTTSAPVDILAPTVSTRTPASAATGVATTGNVTATFSEAVSGVSGTTFTLRNTATGAAVAAAVTQGTGNQWVLNPNVDLAASTSYTATLTGGTTAIRDAANNALGTTSWAFTTAAAAPPGDTTRPTATVAPTANATGASQTGNITATFSEAVTGVGATTFTLRNATTAAAVTATSVTYNATSRVATFDPSITLAADTKYTATLTAGIRDAASNALTATSWTFTTGPRPGIAVGGQAPASNATGVSAAANITATFSEAVLGVTSTTFTVKNAATGAVVAAPAPTRVGTTNQWLLNPTANLANDTRYTVTLNAAIKDAAGNTLSPTGSTWSFTTGPAPTVTGRTPAVNALNVGRTANVTATFSEAVTGANSAANVTLKNATTGVVVAAPVPVYNATTRTVTLNPTASLAANTRYTVTLTTGIKDVGGNPIPATTWSFTTGAV